MIRVLHTPADADQARREARECFARRFAAMFHVEVPEAWLDKWYGRRG
jgi:hypothetical protein